MLTLVIFCFLLNFGNVFVTLANNMRLLFLKYRNKYRQKYKKKEDTQIQQESSISESFEQIIPQENEEQKIDLTEVRTQDNDGINSINNNEEPVIVDLESNNT